MSSSFYIFIAIFIALAFLVGSHIYFRFIKKLDFQKWILPLKILFVYSFLSTLCFPLVRVFDVNMSTLFVIYMGLGSFFLLTFLSLFYDVSRSILKVLKLDNKTINLNRRYALKSLLDVTFIIIGILYFFRAFSNSLKQPAINETNIPLGLDGFRIVQVSDLHISKVVDKDFVKVMVENINKLNPDLVVLTGDIIDDSLDIVADGIYELTKLESKHGIYMSLGNHEYHNVSIDTLILYLKTTNIKLLINDSVVINDKFNLVGLSDRAGYRLNYYAPDLRKAFRYIDNNKPTIVLSHQPIMIEEIEQYTPNLVLAGHTHGGQIFPFGILVKLAQKYLAGLYQHNKDTQIFVSRGAGYWGPPIRVLAPNEVNLLVL